MLSVSEWMFGPLKQYLWCSEEGAFFPNCFSMCSKHSLMSSVICSSFYPSDVCSESVQVRNVSSYVWFGSPSTIFLLKNLTFSRMQ
jgi:hypothetical protein